MKKTGIKSGNINDHLIFSIFKITMIYNSQFLLFR